MRQLKTHFPKFIAIGSVALILVFFQNCGENVEFQSSSKNLSSTTSGDFDVSGAGVGSGGDDFSGDAEVIDQVDLFGNGDTSEVSVNEIVAEEILENLPEEEVEILRQISDIEDPQIEELFNCGSGAVLICHFPNKIESAHTLCVGLNAADTHQQHQIVYNEAGEIEELSDYLGPCRH